MATECDINGDVEMADGSQTAETVAILDAGAQYGKVKSNLCKKLEKREKKIG